MPKSPQNLLKKHSLRPKKQWGQNFLVQPKISKRIVGFLEATEDDIVVEFGAGTGALTHYLVESGAHVIAVERDRELVALLEEEFAGTPVEILAADAAKFDYAEVASEQKLLVIGNLPYQITSPILFRLLEQRQLIKRAVFMVQKEVADRLVAQPTEGKNYSILSIRFGAFFRVQRRLQVSRQSFYPRPKVDSTVIQLDPLEKPRVDPSLEKIFARLVKSAFSSRRKTLLNNFKQHFSEFDKRTILTIFERLGLPEQCRGENLTIEQFAQLSAELDRVRSENS